MRTYTYEQWRRFAQRVSARATRQTTAANNRIREVCREAGLPMASPTVNEELKTALRSLKLAPWMGVSYELVKAASKLLRRSERYHERATELIGAAYERYSTAESLAGRKAPPASGWMSYR